MKTVDISRNSNAARGHITELDGLRGIAVIMVLIAHLRLDLTLTLPIRSFGHGVDLFFVLSGFLITRIRIYEQQVTGSTLLAFWIRRAFRIFPAAYACLFVVYCVFGPSFYLLLAGTYLSNFVPPALIPEHLAPVSHFWSLAVEEQFYILWPLVLFIPLLWVTRLSVIAIVIAFVGLITVGPLLSKLGVSPVICDLINYQTFTRGWPLLAGGLLAINEAAIREKPFVLVRLMLISFFLGLVLKLISIDYFQRYAVFFDRKSLSILSYQFIMLALFLAALWLHYKKPKKTFLNNRVLCWVGSISYGLYLYHLPIYIFVGVRSDFRAALYAILLTFVVSAFSFYSFEHPLLKLGRLLSKRLGEPRRLNTVNLPEIRG